MNITDSQRFVVLSMLVVTYLEYVVQGIMKKLM